MIENKGGVDDIIDKVLKYGDGPKPEDRSADGTFYTGGVDDYIDKIYDKYHR
jgi:hypothetical protein